MRDDRRARRPRTLRTLLIVVGLLGLVFAVAAGAQTSGVERYVAVNGTPGGDGSAARPLDLATAIGSSTPARPGDTIWLRGGTYLGNFTSSLVGTPSAPIVVRQYPGERVTIDGASDPGLPALTVSGSDTWYWGFEVTNSNPQRVVVARNVSINVFGPRTKFINLIVHDGGGGFGLWTPAIDAEVYGTIIYNQGWEGSSSGMGHSIYTQNDGGTRRLTDNILFNGFSFGIHAYTEGGSINNMRWEGNVAFNHGVLSRLSGAKANFLLGGRQVAYNAVIVDNYLYQSPGVGGRHLDIGYGTPCQSPTIWNNYAAGTTALLLNCTNASVTGNTFIGSVSSAIQTAHPNNLYLTAPQSRLHTVVRPNRYEAGRGHVIIYNWDRLPDVNVSLSNLGLNPGDVFEVRDAQNYFGAPLFVGAYTGAPVPFPMTGLTVAAPIGNAPLLPQHTAPEFGVFVVTRLARAVSNLPPSARLSATPQLIAQGGAATLSWSTSLATNVSIQPGIGSVPPTGTLSVQPSATTTYQLTATNAVGSTTTAAAVTVNAPGTATFVRTDATTRGSWKGVYGAQGYSLASDTSSLPSYAQVTPANQSEWVWAANTTDMRALQRANGNGRIAATWFASPSFSIDVAVTDGQSHTVALYVLDWDLHGRTQTIDLIDAVTNTVLDSRAVTSFSSGQYWVWEIKERVRFRVTGTGPNAVVSGLFFDAPTLGGGPSMPTASLSAAPVIVAPGQSSSLSWSTSGATDVSIDQGVGLVPALGTLTVSPSTTTTYTLTAQNSAGAVTRQAVVTVTPLPTASLNVTSSVTLGQPATLTWSSTNATSTSIAPGVGPVGPSGSISVTPSTTTTYVLTATNAAGQVTASGTVTVVAAPTTSTVRFVQTDTVTRGNWKGVYGGVGYSLASDGTALPSSTQVSLSGQSAWTWSSNTADPRALQKAAGGGRVAGTWYSGASFTIDLAIPAGSSETVALYMVDWDSSTRAQTIAVLDATNAVLDSRVVAGFQSGIYLVWQVSGSVRFRVTRSAGANAVISGLFLTGATSGGTSAATFVRMDATTRGNWQGAYGGQGYTLASEATALPGFAQVSLGSQSGWTWSSQTSDVRGLQKTSGSGRIAATWYSGTEFFIDIATDSLPHALALFLVDWDSSARDQTIDLLDVATNAVIDSRRVSNFHDGVYLVWQVSGAIRFRVKRNAGANAVVSGVFFGTP